MSRNNKRRQRLTTPQAAALVPAPAAQNGAVAAEPRAQAPEPDFVWKAHSYTNDYIRFGDTKAGAVVAWSSGLIAALFAAKVHYRFTQTGIDLQHAALKPTLLGLIALTAFAALAAAVLAAFWAIRPRLWTSSTQPGFIFWERVRQHPNAATFWSSLKAQDAVKLTEDAAGHLYDLAGVCQTKYHWVAWSMWLSLVGSIAGAAVVLFSA